MVSRRICNGDMYDSLNIQRQGTACVESSHTLKYTESILKMMLQKKNVLNDMGKWQLCTVKIKSAACTVCYFKKI